MFDFAILICEELGVVLFDVHCHAVSLNEQVALALKYFVKVVSCLSIDINLESIKGTCVKTINAKPLKENKLTFSRNLIELGYIS